MKNCQVKKNILHCFRKFTPHFSQLSFRDVSVLVAALDLVNDPMWTVYAQAERGACVAGEGGGEGEDEGEKGREQGESSS